ncbi:MAG: hypothetical protein AABX51_07155 [Nanoarchaeota archaeon]
MEKSHEGHHHGPLPYFKGRLGLPFKPNYRILIFIVLALFLLFVYRKIVVITVLLVVIMVYDFVIHYFHFPLHIDPMPFASFFVATEYGLPIAVLFVLIGEILPEMLVGHFEIADFFNFVPLIALIVIFFASKPESFFTTGLIALAIYTVVNAAIAFFSGSQPHKFTIEPALDFLINLILIYRVAPLLFLLAG